MTVALVGSCTLPPQQTGEQVQVRHTGAGVSVRQIIQLGFGREAAFAACIEPACPNPTPKTLASAQHAATDATPLVFEPTFNKVATLLPGTAKSLLPREIASLSTDSSEGDKPALILHFPLSSAKLTTADKAALNKLILNASKANRIVISGRTDNVGSDIANRVLALARANTVRDYLGSKLPLPRDALVVDAKGSCCYIASNDTPEGRKRNRRVEIVLGVSAAVGP
ncbi:MAG: OmpA family protein [Burkholderiales bacterium]